MSARTSMPPAPRYLLLSATAFLALGGMLMIYSAASVSDYQHFGTITYHLTRQAAWIAMGLVLLVVAARVDYRVFKRLALPLLVVSDALLVAVDFFGTAKYGAQRSLSIGPFNLQPSEFARLACVLTIAAVLVSLKPANRSLRGMMLPLLGILGPVVVLVMLQPDMGTTMSILIAVYCLLIIGGFKFRDLAGIAVLGAGAVWLMIRMAPYRMERFIGFLDPWSDPQGSGYQIIQALYAFGSGGLGGVGLGLSRQKFFYLPAAHTDFIFAIVGEELGLLGTLCVVAAFVLFAYAGFKVARAARDPYGRLVAGGITAMIVSQAAVNIAAVTGIMPITGIPLPFLSYGGSSMMLNLGCVGLILSVHRFGCRASGARRERAIEEVGHAHSPQRGGNGRAHLSSIDGGRRAAR